MYIATHTNTASYAGEIRTGYANTNVMATNATKQDAVITQTMDATDTVTLSIEAQHASLRTKVSTSEDMSTADVSTLPYPGGFLHGDKIEQYLDFKKAQVRYNIASDMVNITLGNSQHISTSTVMYLKHNDGARAATVEIIAQQQQVNAMKTYANTSLAIQKRQINDWA